MPTGSNDIVKLANRLELDIQQRELRPGEPYLATAEVARLLRVSGTSANKALQILAKRGVIERKQRLGSVIAQPLKPDELPPLHRVHVLVHKGYVQSDGMMVDGTLLGIQTAMPGVPMSLDDIPATDESDYVRELISEALRAKGLHGFVLALGSLPVQRLISECGLPAVHFGSLYPSIPRLSSLRHDHVLMGRLLGEYLLDCGCTRIGLLNRQTMFTGDHNIFEGVRDTLVEAGLSAEAISFRCLPADEVTIRQAARDFIELLRKPAHGRRTNGHRTNGHRSPGRNTRVGLVCRNNLLADGAAQAAESLGLRVPDDVTIVVSRNYLQKESPPRYPFTKPVLTSAEQGVELGKLLLRQARHQSTAAEHVVVPMTLELPSQ